MLTVSISTGWLVFLVSQVCGLDGVYDFVGEAVFDRFLGVEVEVAVGVFLDLVEGFSGGIGEDLVEFVAEFFHFLGLDVDVGCGGNHSSGDEGLVNHDPGVGIDEAFAFGGTGEEDGAHAGSHAGDDDTYGGGDELDGVVDGHACGDGASGGVDVEGDVFAGIRPLQVEEFFGDVFCGFVADFSPEEEFSFFEEFFLDLCDQIIGFGFVLFGHVV